MRIIHLVDHEHNELTHADPNLKLDLGRNFPIDLLSPSMRSPPQRIRISVAVGPFVTEKTFHALYEQRFGR